MPKNSEVISREQMVEVRKARRLLHDLIAALDKANKCGVDCTEMEMIRENMDQALQNIEAEYGHK